MNRTWASLKEFLASAGSPSALAEAANSWSSAVGGPVSAQVQVADAGLLNADDVWSGTAADAYKNSLPRQKIALEKIKSTLTDGIASALAETEKAISTFLSALIVALAALAVGLVGAIASSATIFGIPAAPVIAGAAALTALTAIFAGSMTLESACTSINVTLQQKLADDTAYAGGSWPKSIAMD